MDGAFSLARVQQKKRLARGRSQQVSCEYRCFELRATLTPDRAALLTSSRRPIANTWRNTSPQTPNLYRTQRKRLSSSSKFVGMALPREVPQSSNFNELQKGLGEEVVIALQAVSVPRPKPWLVTFDAKPRTAAIAA
jgi:hypothetical protein